MKQCIVCQKTKELTEYYPCKSTKGGHHNQCKECIRGKIHLYYHRKRKDPDWVEKQKTRTREAYHRLGYKATRPKKPIEQLRKERRQYDARYPEKARARWAVSRTHVGKPKPKNLVYHHWDYSKEHWLDVLTLFVCDHSLIHRHMIYDQERMMFRALDGVLLDTKESQGELLEKLKEQLERGEIAR